MKIRSELHFFQIKCTFSKNVSFCFLNLNFLNSLLYHAEGLKLVVVRLRKYDFLCPKDKCHSLRVFVLTLLSPYACIYN